MKIKAKTILIPLTIIFIILAFFYLSYFKLLLSEDEKIIKPEELAKNESNFLAAINGEPEKCSKISLNEDKDYCWQKYATIERDVKWCEKIIDTTKQKECKQLVSFERAIYEKNPTLCNEIDNENYLLNCADNSSKNNTVNCEELVNKGAKIICSDNQYHLQASTNKDPKMCYQIQGGVQRANCLSEILNESLFSDKDGDGLNFLEEIALYGTNPNEADSDNDKYGDKLEIDAGFNPSGNGQLTEERYFFCSKIDDPKIAYLCETSTTGSISYSDCLNSLNPELRDYCINNFK